MYLHLMVGPFPQYFKNCLLKKCLLNRSPPPRVRGRPHAELLFYLEKTRKPVSRQSHKCGSFDDSWWLLVLLRNGQGPGAIDHNTIGNVPSVGRGVEVFAT
jgi:hypothetical protein